MTELQDLHELIREYAELLDQERLLADRKETLRGEISAALAAHQLSAARSPYGSAQRCKRYRLLPRREAVLSLLRGGDLFPLTHFTPEKVKTLLVPKYAASGSCPCLTSRSPRS